MNVWDALNLDLPSPRDEIIHNYDKTSGAIRQGEYKAIVSDATLFAENFENIFRIIVHCYYA